jgi:hypothetical protein
MRIQKILLGVGVMLAGLRIYHLVLPPLGAPVEGTLRSPDGKAVGGVKVSLGTANDVWCTVTIFTPFERVWEAVVGRRESYPAGATAVTDLAGHFTLGPVAPGTYRINAKAPGSALSNDPVTVLEQPIQRDVTLPAAAPVRGVLRAKDGTPAPNLEISLSPEKSNSMFDSRSLHSDQEGHFHIDDLVAGDYKAAARRPNGWDWAQAGTLHAPNEAAELTLTKDLPKASP